MKTPHSEVTLVVCPKGWIFKEFCNYYSSYRYFTNLKWAHRLRDFQGVSTDTVIILTNRYWQMDPKIIEVIEQRFKTIKRVYY